MRIEISNPALKGLAQTTQPQGLDQNDKGDFGKMLMDAIKEVNGLQQDSMKLQNDVMANRPVEVHDLMIAMESASTAMQMTMQVRNKMLEAYQEISRMQI